jgi:hypothetical protein
MNHCLPPHFQIAARPTPLQLITRLLLAASTLSVSRTLEDNHESSNRGPCRHFVAMPFVPPCYAPQFFFDTDVLGIVRGAMDDRVVADQWSCDRPIEGSVYQGFHVDYQRPLFAEAPEMQLPAYMRHLARASTFGPPNLFVIPATVPRLKLLAGDT